MKRRVHNRRGSVLIAASWAVIVLAAVTLVMVGRMRVETLASANQASRVQAEAIERGAEQFVLAQVDGCQGDAVLVTGVLAEARPVGTGYFWILRPRFDDTRSYDFGITDESGKLNLNTATSDMLLKFPNMLQEYSDSILAWRGGTSATAVAGADDAYYAGLPDPYRCKKAPYESVEELLLVRGITTDMLYGYDTNRNGVLDVTEEAAGGMGTMFNANQDGGLGLSAYVTVYSSESNTAADGSQRINVNTPNAGSSLNNLLRQTLSSARAQVVLAKIAPSRPFRNVLDFFMKTGLTSDEFGQVADKLTTDTATTRPGLVNVNTAPATVFACLPGIEQSDAQALVAKRQTGIDTTSFAWIAEAITPSKAVAIGNLITSRSFQYSADIVAVSGDGRAYKRVRIVVDARQSPPRIVYRKDLTDLGWPLDPAIRTSLRAGRGVPGGYQVMKGGM